MECATRKKNKKDCTIHYNINLIKVVDSFMWIIQRNESTGVLISSITYLSSSQVLIKMGIVNLIMMIMIYFTKSR